MTEHSELRHWLDDATDGLVVEVAAEVREELHMHYEDAYDDYLLGGFSPGEAHMRVMCDLGASSQTADGLRKTHQRERRYKRASFASLAAPLTLILFIPLAVLNQSGVFSETTQTLFNISMMIALSGVSLLALPYVLGTLHLLGGFGSRLERSIQVIVRGSQLLFVMALAAMFLRISIGSELYILVFNDPLVTFTAPHGLDPPANGAVILSEALTGGLLLYVGWGWLLLTHRFAAPHLYGLGGLVYGTFWCSGVLILGTAIAVLLRYNNAVMFFATALCFLSAIKYCGLTLLFYRAAYYPKRKRIQ